MSLFDATNVCFLKIKAFVAYNVDSDGMRQSDNTRDCEKIRQVKRSGGQCCISKHGPERTRARERLFSGVVEQRGLLKYSKSF